MRNPPIEQKDVIQALDIGEEAIIVDHHHPTSPMAASSSYILHKSKHSPSSPRRHNSSKFLLRILIVSAFLFLLFQIHTLHVQHLPQINSPSTSLANFSWPTSLNPFVSTCKNQSVLDEEFSSKALQKLRQSVTFLPLKDLRYADRALVGHTWFMSSLYDSHVEGEVQYQKFPSEWSNGRLLCMKGHDNHDGSWNYYGLAWPGALPENATLAKGLTFVSYNHYDYSNIWHGLSAVIPFGAWHLRNGCRIPARWVLYHWGELRVRMGPWLTTLMEAVYGADGVKIEEFKGVEETTAVCFEEAVVMRHNEGGMSRLRREQVYDLLRCKARAYCNVSADDKSSEVAVGVTMFMRSGGRSFKNDSHVIGIFEKECRKIEGCRLQVAYSNNLTVCKQVKIMSETDVLVSPHGAQLTNMFLMDKGSSVMEFFPKGWLKLAGVGQYVYHWIASWSGMRHQGAWRDSDGPPCEFPEDDRRCMTLYKNAQIGHNETHFIEWAQTVFREARVRKLKEASMPSQSEKIGCGCA